ncbi:MAG: DUF177 domain-containing protein [Sedimentibacter sp.]|uniref:YceD family protein n=1 Tax=Sedimentibacter sp. TaxID=1960295 RepID=UPI0031595ACD
MLIRLNKFLSSDALSFRFNERFAIDDEDFLSKTHLDKDIDFSGEVFKVEDSVLLTGTIRYTFADVCSRCLAEFDNTVETSFEASIVSRLDEDEETDEIQLIVTDGCVELDEIIKQMIYLSMPMKSLCKKDCKGICPTCGVNLNFEECECENNLTDPRFNKLKDLLKD